MEHANEIDYKTFESFKSFKAGLQSSLKWTKIILSLFDWLFLATNTKLWWRKQISANQIKKKIFSFVREKTRGRPLLNAL